MIEVIGKESGQYFNFECSKCGSELYCTFLGLDPVVPHVLFKCENCGEEAELKIGGEWEGLPKEPVKY